MTLPRITGPIEPLGPEHDAGNTVMMQDQHLADFLSSLDAEKLRRRLDDLDSERAALITLLRAARARERAQRRAGAIDYERQRARESVTERNPGRVADFSCPLREEDCPFNLGRVKRLEIMGHQGRQFLSVIRGNLCQTTEEEA